MDMYPKYKSQLGYQIGDDKIDSYGVDHSGFTTRDEVEYQFARDKREQDLIKQYNARGINSNYPQCGKNFWGNPDNNYGFGTCNISDNIENITSRLNNRVVGRNENFEFPNINSNFENLNNSISQGKQNDALLMQNPKGIQVTQNTYVNSVGDANIVSSSKYSDDDLRKRMLPIIKKYEIPLNHIYIDTTWNKTTGAGANIDDWNVFNSIKWKIGDRFATEEEKRAAFEYFNKITSAGKNNVDANGRLIKKNNMAASYYKDKSSLEIPEDEIDRLLRSHLDDDIKYLRREFPDFESYPPELQNVLLDIKFNTGNVDLSKWPNLRKAIAEKNLFGQNGIIDNVNRKDVGDDRNSWARGEIEKINYWK